MKHDESMQLINNLSICNCFVYIANELVMYPEINQLDRNLLHREKISFLKVFFHKSYGQKRKYQ